MNKLKKKLEMDSLNLINGQLLMFEAVVGIIASLSVNSSPSIIMSEEFNDPRYPAGHIGYGKVGIAGLSEQDKKAIAYYLENDMPDGGDKNFSYIKEHMEINDVFYIKLETKTKESTK